MSLYTSFVFAFPFALGMLVCYEVWPDAFWPANYVAFIMAVQSINFF